MNHTLQTLQQLPEETLHEMLREVQLRLGTEAELQGDMRLAQLIAHELANFRTQSMLLKALGDCQSGQVQGV
jgi:hypothetical protein